MFFTLQVLHCVYCSWQELYIISGSCGYAWRRVNDSEKILWIMLLPWCIPLHVV